MPFRIRKFVKKLTKFRRKRRCRCSYSSDSSDAIPHKAMKMVKKLGRRVKMKLRPKQQHEHDYYAPPPPPPPISAPPLHFLPSAPPLPPWLDDRGRPKKLFKSRWTKVKQQGRNIGGNVDLGRFHGYDELFRKLELDFDIVAGQLSSGSTQKYQALYVDFDDDYMMIGDLPWHMFLNDCKEIFITDGVETTTADVLSSSTRVPTLSPSFGLTAFFREFFTGT